MKEKLVERLQIMDEAIKKQTATLQAANTALQQANADLNMLNGCRQELLHVMTMFEQEGKDIQEEHKEDKFVNAMKDICDTVMVVEDIA